MHSWSADNEEPSEPIVDILHKHTPPASLLSVFDAGLNSGLQAVSRSLGFTDTDYERTIIRRRVLVLFSKLQDSALLTDSSSLADWAVCKDLDSIPADAPSQVLYLVALSYRILLTIDDYEQLLDDTQMGALKCAVNDGIAAIASQPIKARVQAIKILRDEERERKLEPGPGVVDSGEATNIFLTRGLK